MSRMAVSNFILFPLLFELFVLVVQKTPGEEEKHLGKCWEERISAVKERSIQLDVMPDFIDSKITV